METTEFVAGPGKVGGSRDRALYELAKQMAKPLGVTPTMGFLREEVVLANNSNVYNFFFNEQRAGIRPTEKMLSIKDAFIGNRVQLGILVERKSKPGSGVIYQYPNANELAKCISSVGGAAATTAAITVAAADLESVFNGQLRAQFDQEILIDGLDTRRFRQVPEQPSIALSVTGGFLSQGRATDGVLDVEPNLIFSGTKKNQFQLVLPQYQESPAFMATDGAWEVKVVLTIWGFHIPGGANLGNKR